MICTLYALEEMRRKRQVQRESVLVVARRGRQIVLAADGEKWRLPSAVPARGESREETAQRALGAAMGESVFEVFPLCGYSVTGADGKEHGGWVYRARVDDWPDEGAAEARAFSGLPNRELLENPLLTGALRRWAWPFFDDPLDGRGKRR